MRCVPEYLLKSHAEDAVSVNFFFYHSENPENDAFFVSEEPESRLDLFFSYVWLIYLL